MDRFPSTAPVSRAPLLQNLGVAAGSEVEYVAGPGLRAVRINDAQVRTFAHVASLAARQDSAMVCAFVRCAQDARPAPA